jgi:serine/threonine protein phosphatase PrpC
MAIALRYAARSDVGLVRSTNQDSGYAGPHLLVIADGMGGHVGGDVASSLAIGELAPLDDESHGTDGLTHLSQAVLSAHRQLLGRVSEEPALSGMGTTVTALLRTGTRFALAHIGDSRAYLLRDGTLVQITRDHTFVQTLVDEGRLTPAEAEQHPQRSVLMRVLSDVVDDVEPDLSMRETRIGDRYLLCSDGLSGVVSFDTLTDTLAAGKDPETTCDVLVQLALRSGAPDNVTCIVADVVDDAETPPELAPSVVGAATTGKRVRSASASSAAERAAELTADPDRDDGVNGGARPAGRRGSRLRLGFAVALVLAVLAGGGYAAYRWSQAQFFVGTSAGMVAVFRGLPQDLGPVSLSRVDQVADDVPIAQLPPFARTRLEQGIVADGESSAHGIVQTLREQAAACSAAAASPSPTSSARPSATPRATSGPTASASATPGAGATAGTTGDAGDGAGEVVEDCGGLG